MDYYTIGEFAKKIGKSPQTLRNWDKKNKLKPDHLSTSGYRMYSKAQVNACEHLLKQEKTPRKIIGYCGVLHSDDALALQKQIELVCSYMVTKGYQFEIIKDVGFTTDRVYLPRLIQLIIRREVERVVIFSEECLPLVGYGIMEVICKECRTSIEVINHTQQAEEFFFKSQQYISNKN